MQSLCQASARSAYGPKIFSMALLFASTVLLNSVKVLNDQFFAFFTEQQQLARVLRAGLLEEGLPSCLLPENLTISWIIQQPISYDASGKASQQQLEEFLDLPDDASRTRVKRDFHHVTLEVPVATNDFRQWSKLDQLTDEDLLPEYLAAVARLRSEILQELRVARPLQANAVGIQLRMYADLVQNQHFSGTLAKEAFEESEIGELCDSFTATASDFAGALPSTSLLTALSRSEEATVARRRAKVEEFHLSESWGKRVDACIHAKREEMIRRNGEAVFAKWTTEAGQMAQEGDCFFLGSLARLLRNYSESYGEAFSRQVQGRAVEYGSALQRTRLAECVRLRDLLGPVLPWLSWPLCSLYLWGGIASGIFTMTLHVVILSGLYHVAQTFNQLPQFLDIDYKILRAHPILLDFAMRAPPLVPWGHVAHVVMLLGCLRLVVKLGSRIVRNWRRPGHGFQEAQLVNLELKLNMMLKRSEALLRQQLTAAALKASDHLDKGDARGAARSVIEGLCLVRNIGDSDHQLSAAIGSRLRHRCWGLLDNCALPDSKVSAQMKACASCSEHGLVLTAARGDLEQMLEEMANVLERLAQHENKENGAPRTAALSLEDSPPPKTKRHPVPPASPEFQSPLPRSSLLVSPLSSKASEAEDQVGEGAEESCGQELEEDDEDDEDAPRCMQILKVTCLVLLVMLAMVAFLSSIDGFLPPLSLDARP